MEERFFHAASVLCLDMHGEGGWSLEEGFGFQLDFQAGTFSIPAAGKGMAVEGDLNL